MKSILIVEDTAIFRETIESVLRNEGFDVRTVGDGMQALAALSTRRPDLMLLDLGLPVLSGMAVLQRIRADVALKRTPVVILSAENEREAIVEALKLGISGYLIKSQFSIRALLEKVGSVLAPAGEQASPAPSAAQGGAQAGETRRPGALTPEAAAKELKMMRPLITRPDLINRLARAGDLKGFSPAVSQVVKLLSTPRCSAEEVAKAVGQDHGLALKVLRIANSSAYSRGDHVDTVHKAVLRIGLEQIRDTALSIGVVEQFSDLGSGERLTAPFFWEHSIAAGLIASEIAHALKQPDSGLAFTTGLLHDLGRVILAEVLGETYQKVLAVASELLLPLEEVEARLLTATHAEVMEQVLRAWHFPKELINPIIFHHVPARNAKEVSPAQGTQVLRLGLAERLAHALLLGSSGNDTLYPTEEHCRLLGLEPAHVETIRQMAGRGTDEMKLSLLTRSSDAPWPRRIEQHRRALKAPARPLYVSAAPHLDAYKLFCDELAGRTAGETPNIAIVHLTTPKEREAVFQALAQEEKAANARGLPIIVLFPTGQSLPEEPALAGRRCRMVGTPTPVARLLLAINDLLGAEVKQRAA